MKLHSYKFPAKLENFEFTAPYTITEALQIEDSHYVGYTLCDSVGVEVEVFDIFGLKKHITTHKEEFTNVSICDVSNQLIIDNFENLPHLNSDIFLFEHEIKGLTEELFNLLEVNDIVTMPKKAYDYKVLVNGQVNCKLNSKYKDYITHLAFKKSKNILVIPPPLQIYEGKKVTNYSYLYKNLNFWKLNLDFSLVDLRYCENAKSMFASTKIRQLDFAKFNSTPVIATSMFEGLLCERLNLNNCNFSNTIKLDDFLKSSKIQSLTATNCIMPTNLNSSNKRYYKNQNIYNHAYIGEFDLEFFSNMSKENIVKSSGSMFYYLKCEKFVNIQKLPIGNATELPNFFRGLTIKELDLQQAPFNSLEDFSKLFKQLRCKKLILNNDFFDNATKANELFKECILGSDLDLSKVSFCNLLPNNSENMFHNFKIFGNISLPANFTYTKYLANLTSA